ncbi:unnamed protein product [Paramecium pentaurelia]|uniref:EGF-like domain-containing protein n=1 Tax=Paramecium pentaurelia TaxID=43138 RepID=A0A8S1WWE4_9CILI|nr:unnamed protein product [Paramecium pentaurelia]
MEQRKNKKLLVLILSICCLTLGSTLTCTEGQYISGSQCLDCSSGCKECISNTSCSLCKEGYMLSSYSCYSCGNGCQKCLGLSGSASRILYRSGGFRILATPTQTECITCYQGYYQQGSVCIACDKPCLACSSNSTNCTICVDSINQSTPTCQCNESYIMNTSTYQCTSQNIQQTCEDGYYLDITQQCQVCIFPCLKCTNQQECIECLPGLIQFETTCKCPFGQYEEIDKCVNCQLPCLSCQGSASKCLACAPQNQVVNEIFQCVCDYGYSLIEQNCELCQTPCLTCDYRVDYCTSCMYEFQVINDGKCVCKFGYLQNDNNECQQCQSPCESCENAINECLTCIDTNQYVNLNKQCICKEGFYLDFFNINCVPCHYTCQSCDNQSCLRCLDTTLQLEIGSSSCNCPIGYYYENTKCLQCQLQCSKCIDQSDKCLECADPNSTLIEYQCICNTGFGISKTNLQYCIPCKYPCLECSNDVNKCTSCFQISLIYLVNQECRCPQGYFMQDFDCIKCANQCQECQIDSDNCINCIDLSYEFMNNGCFCPYGYYVDTSLKCSQCQEPCSTCEYNYDFCLSCIDPLAELINNSCQCQLHSVQVFDNNNNLLQGCYKCNEIYLNCDICNQSICQLCLQGYNFNENQECLNTICGDSIKVDNEQCDDGNDIEFDGCFQCQCEFGWIQNQLGCQSICGDEIIVIEEQCDDGNDIQFDGCYQCKYDCNQYCNECIEGICMKCKEGFILEENQCIITCGDGILNIQTEQCDDYNNTPRDGCYNCYQEDGFICYYTNQLLFQSCERCSDYNCIQCVIQNQKQICQKCIDGYYIDSFQGCSQCDQICVECIIYPKNCIIFNSSFYQLKDCNQNLGLYYDYELQDCITKCGDGIINGQEQCDDLNINDFDGCNNKCQIESGYLFDQISLSFINEPLIQVQSQTSSNNDFSIYAEQFQDTINCTGTTINIELFNQSEYNYTINEQGLNCDISIQYFKTVEYLNLIHIFIKFKNHFTKRILDEIPIKEIIIVPKRQVYANEDQKEQGKTMAAVSKSLTSSIVVFAPLALLIGGFKFIWAILDIMSWMNNFYFLNVNYPENVRLIFQQAEWSNLINFPQLNIFNQPSDEYYFQAQIKFTEKDVDPLFINNIQIVIIFLLQVLITYIICFLFRKLMQTLFKKNIKVKNPSSTQIFQLQNNITNIFKQENQIKESKVNNQISIFEIPNKFKSIYISCIDCERSFLANLLKTLQISYLDILLAIVLQITNQQTSTNLIVKINIILAITFIGIVLLLIHLSYSISVQHHLKLDNHYFSRRYSCFYEDIKTNSKISMTYSFVNMLRKTIFIAATVLLYDFPIYQTSICFLSCFLNIILLFLCNPFHNRQQYILNFIPDFCICIIVGITIIFAFQDQYQIVQDDNIYILGWIIGVCIYLSILLQLIFLIKELIESIWKKIKELYLFLKNKYN